MKKILLTTSALAIALAGITSASAVGFTDPANGPGVDPAWGVDRRLPTTVAISGGAIELGVTPAGYDGPGSFYNYQGIQRDAGGVVNWIAKAQLEVTSDLLGGLANASFWLRTGLPGDENTADYNIIAFRNPTGSAGGFYTFDDVNGLWLPTLAPVTLGWHDFEMSYLGGTVTYSIDGSIVRTDNALGNPAYANSATTAFLEIYNYGDRSYSARFDNVSVTSAAVPDKGSTLALLGCGITSLCVIRRKTVVA